LNLIEQCNGTDNILRESLPYERFTRFGPTSLTDAELLAIIIRTGTRSSSPMDIAGRILSMGRGKERGLNCLFSLSLEELEKVNGIGKVKAVKLKCIAELAKRMAGRGFEISMDCSEPSEVARVYMEKLRHEESEKVILLCLNNRLGLISEDIISMGTANSASVSPREIFMFALKAGASYVLLLHNHPGGDPSPSKADVSLTNKICRSGEMLGIGLIDHIIIGDKSYTSFKEKGLLWS
jgi:DNA repair protein RadC